LTVAEADWPAAVAWIVSGFVAGTFKGAVYSALDSFPTIVPKVAFPPATPFMSQATDAGGLQKLAVKICVWPSTRVTFGGDTEARPAHVIVMMWVADRDGSAMLVAVRRTEDANGADEGAM
jgi:hypothetical protein